MGLRWPTGLALGREGYLCVADQGNGALRRIDPAAVSSTHLMLTGRRWPTAVPVGPNGEVLVAAAALDDYLRPRTRLISIEAKP